ncbi:bifunctional diaminohydroxyphosphoribosylaminopyrimidine deaminase/5-amino-6-(5-phosphoribosylamino)uracil reductase RibD [Pectinatus frisingensis]|jgi:diaminohydroxyphosphoribosylaminopyrimidine deaminase/5-amino-6-(5-phosphoribosylamino)uracil reductase|uniref:bifunctional diaminohydroxyphosphoribosylaminopyrimidine deaminase/5-amino-6-(5-phosphoribosylamino)uracil reductase RibD n=1 Tax=Pectinatus frisingensis TaxID=865 RepID=UPI0018C820CD|nr:bifunctional diaminohydroxyphosphoribosylaminopyrimidine deaminase/5-amino-6-(5-phosphoribosylamino)uracil reductase RibD [Pectinatus frisingensis]
MNDDERYMQTAINLAKNAVGRTSPNPMVGAVIVKNNRIIGCGWHKKAGTPHAEIHALQAAGELSQGATLYVSLEPCSHFGRTPPCCDAVIKAGIKRVVVAITDPNPKVSGRGIKKMRDAGLEVVTGVLENEAAKLNEVFFKWIETGFPFITIKSAMSLDGKTATASGQSKWITNEASRTYGHHLRDINDAIMVGINTIIADNPTLTTRLAAGGKNPIRIITDSTGRIPLDAAVLNDNAALTLVVVTAKASPLKIAALKAKKNVDVIIADAAETAGINLTDLFKQLAQREICSILIEGGATLIGNIVEEKLADKAYFFIAPKIVGGKSAKSAVEGPGIKNLADALTLASPVIKNLDGDFLISGNLNKGGTPHCSQE